VTTPRNRRVKIGDQVLVFSEVEHKDGDAPYWKLNSLGLGVFEGFFEDLEDDGRPMTEEEQVIYFTLTNALPVQRILMFDGGVVFDGDEVHWDVVDVMQGQLDSIKEPIQWSHTSPKDYREYLDYRDANNAAYEALMADAVTIYNPRVPRGQS